MNKHSGTNLKLDLREDLALQFQKIIEPLLLSCLGDRISEMCFNVCQESIGIEKTQEPLNHFLIGLKLNSQKSNAVVERGPTANLPEVLFIENFIMYMYVLTK